MNLIQRFSLLTLLLLTAAGCKMNLTGNVFLSDLYKVPNQAGKELLTSGVLRLEMASATACEQERSNLASTMNHYFINFKPMSCESLGMENFLIASIDLPLTGDRDQWTKNSWSVFALQAQRSQKIGGIEVSLLLNQGQFKKLSKTVAQKYFDQMDLNASQLSVKIHNDQSVRNLLLVSGVFVNGEPIVEEDAINISPREQMEIDLSDVQRDHLSSYGWTPVFSLITGI
ncbi:MAG: hypothetical protein G3M78_09440 [Candidatus Nitrohelix vancouverensis]|uniref:DUF7424 domain-containing protein n=1 Tax=Candidatus Nitrohelix vancouverensis TaxID=2705534 RepID=A0A7T0C329_9BACT|nr:MAG: hypothetical protein G3M78_09440 [Candidatus Nitrohelix vancouverensis]